MWRSSTSGRKAGLQAPSDLGHSGRHCSLGFGVKKVRSNKNDLSTESVVAPTCEGLEKMVRSYQQGRGNDSRQKRRHLSRTAKGYRWCLKESIRRQSGRQRPTDTQWWRVFWSHFFQRQSIDMTPWQEATPGRVGIYSIHRQNY